MTVEVDRSSIAKAQRKAAGGEFYFEFVPTDRSRDVADADALRAVKEATTFANEDAVNRHGPDRAPFVEGVSDSDRGVSALMNPAGDVDQTLGWLENFAGELARHSWSGQIRAARSTWPPGWSLDQGEVGRAIGAFLRFTPDETSDSRPEQAGIETRPDDLAGLATLVDEWNTRKASRSYLVRGEFSSPAPSHDLGTALVEAVLRNRAGDVTWVDRPSRTTACAGINAEAQAFFSIASTTKPWQARLEAVTSVLEHIGSRLEAGMVRITQPQGNSWGSVRAIPPAPPSRIAATHTLELARNYVLDAYGIQVLTGRHLAAARDLKDWHITDLGNDRHLVRHPDPEAWYAQDTPDPDTLAAARRDFGGLIITDDVYNAVMNETRSRNQ
ncbi:hypothetical protein [Promicromonospora sukumoe]|uniref:hypothetical protein n=1 Tax=Promicromonospora sukumoe TaxID=88382 RepID=UPI003650F817